MQDSCYSSRDWVLTRWIPMGSAAVKMGSGFDCSAIAMVEVVATGLRFVAHSGHSVRGNSGVEDRSQVYLQLRRGIGRIAEMGFYAEVDVENERHSVKLRTLFETST